MRPCRLLSMALAWSLAWAPMAHAHGVGLVVSRDSTSKLCVNGPSDYLAQAAPVELLPGGEAFKGYWMVDEPGISTLVADGLVRERLRLRDGHRLALKLLSADHGLQVLLPSTWKVVLARPGDTFEFVQAERGSVWMQMITRANRLGMFRARFQFVDRAGLHKPSAPFELRFEAVTDSVRAARAAATPGMAPDGHVHFGAPLVVPTSYPEAVEALRLRLHDANMWIAARQYCRVSDNAVAMRVLADTIRGLAAAERSGVPASARSRVDSAATAAVSAAQQLHMATDWSDPIGAREHCTTLRNALDVFETYVPGAFACPMGCEGDKTYPAAGTCPVCGMTLVDRRAHQDHEPRHGGVFMMSPDMKHHLEAALGADHVVRVYFYDEYTRAIAVEGIRGRIQRSGATGGRAITLAPTPGDEILAAALPRNTRRPVRVTLTVDFGDGSGEQTYDVEFGEVAN